MITRRTALKGAACGLAATATLGNTAFADETSDPLAPLAEIDDAQISETVECEIAVVGLGIAGVAAFRSAAENGAKVVGIERTSSVCARSSDFAYFNTETAREMGIEDIFVPGLVNELMKQMNHRPDARILKRWAENAGEAFDWYVSSYEGFQYVPDWGAAPEDENAVFAINGNYYVGAVAPFDEYDPAQDHERVYSATMEFNPFGHAPVLKANCEAALATGNAECRFDAAAKTLVVEDGSVRGLVYENLADGSHVKVLASKGVVLATGGYSHNAGLMARYIPAIQDEIDCYVNDYPHTDIRGEFTDMGDGLVMGANAGAKIEPAPHVAMAHSTLGSLGVDCFLMLNAEGERFINEDLTIDHFSVNVMNQPKNTCFQLFDATWRDHLDNVQAGIGTYHSGGISDEKAGNISEWTHAEADTIEELVDKMGLEGEAAAKAVDSVTRYNELCEKGVDEDFGKRPERLFPMATPPFYAIRFNPLEQREGRGAMRLLVTMGGLVTNPGGNCLDADDEPIPGLYAVGNCQGGRFYGSYPCTIAGTSHSIALTYGRLVGRDLALA